MKTAVNWLDEQLQDTMYFVYGYTDGVRKVTIPLEDYMKFKQEALELEKEQIIDARNDMQKSCIELANKINPHLFEFNKKDAEQYYNETYGSKGSDEHIVDTNEMISSQTEISDEEIEKASENAWSDYEYEEGNLYSTTFKGGWKLAIKWYREQLKNK